MLLGWLHLNNQSLKFIGIKGTEIINAIGCIADVSLVIIDGLIFVTLDVTYAVMAIIVAVAFLMKERLKA